MPIYMEVDKGAIKGEVTEGKHKDWIELLSAQMGINRSITTAVGRGKSREASTPAISEIVVTKNHDGSSLNLFKWAVGGAEGKTVKIDFTAAGGGDNPHVYYQFELTNTLISSYSMSGHGGEGSKPMESLALNFTKIQVTYIPTDEKAKVKGEKPVAAYDLLEAKAS